MFIATLIFTVSCMTGIFFILKSSNKKESVKVMILKDGSRIYPKVIKHINTWV